MYKKVNWNAQLKDHRQYNWKYFNGEEELNLNQNLDYNIMLEIKSRDLININDRLIKYTITFNINPNHGKILIDGDCILYSTDQKTIELIIESSPAFRKRIEYTIYKHVLPVMEEISKENGIPFPANNLLIDSLKQRFQEEIKNYREMASKMDIDKLEHK